MTDEEAIEELKHLNREGNILGLTKHEAIERTLNLIEKQNSRIKELEEVAEYWRKEFERVLTESNLID